MKNESLNKNNSVNSSSTSQSVDLKDASLKRATPCDASFHWPPVNW